MQGVDERCSVGELDWVGSAPPEWGMDYPPDVAEDESAWAGLMQRK